MSGSLLGTVLGGAASFPVGYARILRMLPLDFEELCWAMGVPSSILGTVRSCHHAKTPLEATLHGRLTPLFCQHIAVGGVPEAVQGFLNRHHDLGESLTFDADIIEQHRHDITKHAGKSTIGNRTT